MQERVEQLDGTLHISGNAEGRGTVIEVTVPLSHLLPPETPEASPRKLTA
jgi:two-component system NarL family sensor kinase